MWIINEKQFTDCIECPFWQIIDVNWMKIYIQTKQLLTFDPRVSDSITLVCNWLYIEEILVRLRFTLYWDNEIK